MAKEPFQSKRSSSLRLKKIWMCLTFRAYYFWEVVWHRLSKIQRQGSGSDLPQVGEFVPFPVTRRANSYSIMMEADMENGRSYQERPRTFSTVRSKSSVPLVWTILSFLHLSKYMNRFSGYIEKDQLSFHSYFMRSLCVCISFSCASMCKYWYLS